MCSFLKLSFQDRPSFSMMKGHKVWEYRKNPRAERVIKMKTFPFLVAISCVKRILFLRRIAWWVEGKWIHQSAERDKSLSAGNAWWAVRMSLYVGPCSRACKAVPCTVIALITFYSHKAQGAFSLVFLEMPLTLRGLDMFLQRKGE